MLEENEASNSVSTDNCKVSIIVEAPLSQYEEIFLDLLEPGVKKTNEALRKEFIGKIEEVAGIKIDDQAFNDIRRILIDKKKVKKVPGRGGGTIRPLEETTEVEEFIDTASKKEKVEEQPSEPFEELYRRKRIEENLRVYLGDLFIVVNSEDSSHFNKILPRTLCSVYLHGDNISMKKAAVYLLLREECQKTFRYMTVSDLLSLYLGKEANGDLEGDPNRRSHLDLSSPVLILHNVKYSVSNRSMQPLMCQQIDERKNRGLITIVLDESGLKDVKDAMNSMGLPVIEKRLVSVTTSDSNNNVVIVKSPSEFKEFVN